MCKDPKVVIFWPFCRNGREKLVNSKLEKQARVCWAGENGIPNLPENWKPHKYRELAHVWHIQADTPQMPKVDLLGKWIVLVPEVCGKGLSFFSCLNCGRSFQNAELIVALSFQWAPLSSTLCPGVTESCAISPALCLTMSLEILKSWYLLRCKVQGCLLRGLSASMAFLEPLDWEELHCCRRWQVTGSCPIPATP